MIQSAVGRNPAWPTTSWTISSPMEKPSPRSSSCPSVTMPPLRWEKWRRSLTRRNPSATQRLHVVVARLALVARPEPARHQEAPHRLLLQLTLPRSEEHTSELQSHLNL